LILHTLLRTIQNTNISPGGGSLKGEVRGERKVDEEG